MKVYYWTPYMEQVGTIKATINSAIALKKMGYDVRIYKPYREWEGYEQQLAENGIEIIDFGLDKRFKNLSSEGIGYRISMLIISFFSFGIMKKNMEEDRPEVIVSSLLGYLPLLVRDFSKYKPKVICSIQGKPKYHSVRKVLWNWLYAKADKIITLTESTKSDMLEKLNLEEEKFLVLDNPVIDHTMDTLCDEPVTEDVFNGENKVILGVGRLTRQKDFETLFKAFVKVREKVANVKLVILGEGEDREKLEAYVRELGIEEDVYMPGFVTNPYKYMKKANVFVLSSLWEDPGHVLMEAAYLKTPIVSTKCPHGPEEFLSYGKAGNMCEVGDAEGMAAGICDVLENETSQEVAERVELAYQNSMKYHISVHGELLSETIEALMK